MPVTDAAAQSCVISGDVLSPRASGAQNGFGMNASGYNPPPHQALSLLYVSRQLLILNKPSGLLTVPGRGSEKSDCLLSRVQEEFPDAMIVHRLDMDTSGIVVMARGPRHQRAISILFQERRVTKRYQALVDGRWSGAAEGAIDLPLIVDWPNRPKQKIDPVDGRPSLTRYRVIGEDAARDATRVELLPITGRSHQLRVHMEAAGHPILGDELYGTERSRAKADRLLLHACFIEFPHPDTGKPISAASPPPF
jgi:tRNA pseudouridine32 synthase/23S rRNA pseudouridine746 synthase